MRRWMIGIGAACATGGLAGLGAMAQDARFADRGPAGFGRPGSHRAAPSPEDHAAFTDARLAALRAGLRLSPDQDKLWPPVEAALRDLAAQRRQAMQERRERRQQRREMMGPDADFPALLRGMADRQGARADALRRLADASAPLYASLDDAQKRRAFALVRMMRPHGWGHHGGWRRGFERGRGDE
jgi:zinc resistance-associated protein